MRFCLRTLLILLAIGPPICAAPFACPCTDDAKLNQIRIGMTREDVEAVAGRPVIKHKVGQDGEWWEYFAADFWPTAFLNPVCVRFNSNGSCEAKWVH